jgi:hypothetical protein
MPRLLERCAAAKRQRLTVERDQRSRAAASINLQQRGSRNQPVAKPHPDTTMNGDAVMKRAASILRAPTSPMRATFCPT